MRLPRRPGPLAFALGATAALALGAPLAHATNHEVQMTEVAAVVDGDSNAQFVEMQPFFGDQVAWGPGHNNGAFDGSNFAQLEVAAAKLVFFATSTSMTPLGEFAFPHDAPTGSTSVLIGTQAYKNLAARPDPDFLLPNGLIVPGGRVCFTNSPENIIFTITTCLIVPTTAQTVTPTPSGLPAVTTCPSPFIQCNGICVNTQINESNCGACGTTCAMGTTCTNSICQTGTTCGPGQTSCGGVCVNTTTDNKNCGACGLVCAGGTSCTNGACQPICNGDGGTSQTLCNGMCVNTSIDNNNCGTCGLVCAAGTSCSNGVCQTACAMGQTQCGGACVDTSNDNNNCGACGNVCSGGNTCAGGVCQSACAAGLLSCGGKCLDVSNDPNNCGACGNACSSGTCRGGACQAKITVGDPVRGRALFTQETFGGNGRTCATCHVLDNGGTGGLSPLNIAIRFTTLANTFDPLFIAEANMNLNTLTIDAGASFADGAILTSVTSDGQTARAKVLARKNVFDGTVLLVYGGLSPRMEMGGTVSDGVSSAHVVSLVPGSLDRLEDPRHMRTTVVTGFPQGRGLILENIDADLHAHPGATDLFVFRKSPHMQNLRFTGPFGFSSDVADLGDFAEGAVIQHFPRTLNRRAQGSPGIADADADFRLPTPQEKADIKAFLESPSLDSIPGTSPTKFNVGNFARTLSQRRGLQLFRTTGQCTLCHLDQGNPANPVFSNPARFNTGVSNQLINRQNEGVPGDGLPSEPPGQSFSTRAFSVPGLFNVKRNTPLFHDASAARVEDAVRFYTTQNFRDAFGLNIALSDADIKDVAAFLESLVARNYTVTSGGVDLLFDGGGLDFGNTVVGTTAGPATITVTNTSSSPLHFDGVTLTGADAAAYVISGSTLTNVDLPPGGTGTVTLLFKPTTGVGRRMIAVLELNTGDPTGVDLSSFVLPSDTGGAPNIDFSQDSGGQTPAGFTVQRGGTFVASGGQLRMTSSAMPVAPNGNVLTHSFTLPESFTLLVDGISTATASNVNDFSVIFNFQDINNYYYASFNETDKRSDGTDDPNTNGIFKVVNGVRTQIRDFSSTTAPGDATAALLKIRVEKMRKTIRVFRGNTLMGVVTDSTFTGGKAGVGSFNDSGRFDNFIIRPHLLSEDFTSSTNPFTKFLGGTFTVTGGKFQLTAPATSTTPPNSNLAAHATSVTGDFDLFVDGNAPASSSTTDDFTVVFNFQNTTNYMFVNFEEKDESSGNGIFKVVNSVRTKLGGFGATVTAPGTARRIHIQRVGASIKVLRDGTQIGPTVTDSTFTGGKVGVGSRNNAATFDNFFVEQH